VAQLVKIFMGNLDGYTMLACLREEGWSDVPASALTGFARPDDDTRSLAAGFDKHVGRSFQLGGCAGRRPRAGLRSPPG
jgi:CheY-like chemotaxis protein